MNRVKAALEASLDEAEENCEREKRAKNDLDKARRKLETDLKNANGVIEEVSRLRQEVQESLQRKEAECKGLSVRLEESGGQLAAVQRKNKELGQQLTEAQEETEAERVGRLKII